MFCQPKILLTQEACISQQAVRFHKITLTYIAQNLVSHAKQKSFRQAKFVVADRFISEICCRKLTSSGERKQLGHRPKPVTVLFVC